MCTLGKYIKDLRTKKGFSQRQLALYSGISNTEISRIESGQRQKPSPDTLKKLAPHLNIKYEVLLQVAGYIPSVDKETSSIYTETLTKRQHLTDKIIQFLIDKDIIQNEEELNDEKIEWLLKILDKAIDISKF